MDPIEQIKQRIDIADFIREFFPLQLAGSNYKARCPFHQEKSASFMVSIPKQIWHCFGCNEGGDIFSFVMKMEGLDFAGALRLLAERAGVRLERQDPRTQGQRNKLLDLIDLASRYYQQALLKSPKSALARDYLAQRGIDDSLVDEFRIGYAFADVDHLYQFLISKKCTPQEIIQAGLAIQREQGYGCFDRFRDRIMIPIRSIHGDVVGFGGRILTPNEKSAKYINSPQTPLYDKGATVFGLDKAKHDIRKENAALLVEGYMDFLAVYGSGIRHVVASSGTALTSEQLKLLKRFTHNLSFAFDMDAAGSQATHRGIELALKEGMNVRIVCLPRDENGKPLYKDPDECIRKDKAAWRLALDTQVSFFDYLIRQTITPAVLRDGFAKKQAARTLLGMIHLLPDRIEQDHWVGVCAQELNIPHALLWEELMKRPRQSHSEQALQSEKPVSIQDRLASLLARYPVLIEDIRVVVTSAMFSEQDPAAYMQHMFSVYEEWQSRSEETRESFDAYYAATVSGDNAESAMKRSLLCDKEYGSLDPSAARELAMGLGMRIREQYRKSKIEELQRLMAQAERSHDTEAMKRYLEEFHCLQQENRV